MEKLQNLINHIAFVIDASGSMGHLRKEVEDVFDREIENLKKLSLSTNQETRLSVYLFEQHNVDCLVFDMDVMRMKSLRGHYQIGGGTNLIDATLEALRDSETLPQVHGDHAFLTYVITDGQENTSRNSIQTLSSKVKNLPDNYTVSCMVPSAKDIFYAEKYGFPKNNIAVWSTTKEGLKEAGEVFSSAVSNYMTMRASGIRSTTSFYNVDTSKLTKKEVKSKLEEVPANTYTVVPVRKKEQIKNFAESWLKKPFANGSGYYELMKPETVPGYKSICIQDKTTGKVYGPTNAVRELLKLPSSDVRINPADSKDYRIFIQSTAVNRNLIPGTQCLLRW